MLIVNLFFIIFRILSGFFTLGNAYAEMTESVNLRISISRDRDGR